jgi:ATP-dependent Clp protease ATP-binding subunit ClpC
VQLSARYISDRFLPDKAIDLIDEAGSRVKLRSYTPPEEIKRLEEEIRQLEAEKTASVNAQDFEGAAKLRDKEKHGRELLEHKKEEWKQAQENLTATPQESHKSAVSPVQNLWKLNMKAKVKVLIA